MVEVDTNDKEDAEVEEAWVEVELPEDKITLEILLNTREYVFL